LILRDDREKALTNQTHPFAKNSRVFDLRDDLASRSGKPENVIAQALE
jgi:hypothetical protein